MRHPKMPAPATLATLGLAAAIVAVASLHGGGAAANPAPGPAPAAAPRSAQSADPWVAPAKPKTAALVYDRFEKVALPEGMGTEKTTCVLADGGDLFVGTDAGLAVRCGGAWRVFGEADGLAHPYVTSISRAPGSGDVWVSTLRGLSRLSGDSIRTWRQTDSGLANDVVYHVVAEGELVWAATGAGLSCLDLRTGGWSVWDHRNSIMHEPWCYGLAVGPGRTWVAVWGGGVVELDRGNGEWREYRDPDGEMEIDLVRDDGPIHDVSAFVAYDEGVLWQATYFGLSRFDGRRWRSYLDKDTGLPSNFIAHVSAWGRTAFLATDAGFAVFDGTTLVSYRRTPEGRCDVRTWRDGREVGRSTLDTAPPDDYGLWAQGGESEAWIATGRGLAHAVAAAKGATSPTDK